MIWNSYPKPYVDFIAKPSTYAACYLIEFCQIVVTLSEIHFILPWSRSRTHFHHMQWFYTRSKQTSTHPQNKTPSPCMTPLSQKYIKDMGLCKKKKMHTQRRYATCFGMSKKKEKDKRCIPKERMPHAQACQKKRREKIAPYPKEKKKKRWFIQRSSYTIHQKYPHTYTSWSRFMTSWSRFMTCFSFGSGLWLREIWEAGMPSNPPYLQLHKNNHER